MFKIFKKKKETSNFEDDLNFDDVHKKGKETLNAIKKSHKDLFKNLNKNHKAIEKNLKKAEENYKVIDEILNS